MPLEPVRTASTTAPSLLVKQTHDDAGRRDQPGGARRLDCRSAGAAGRDVAALARHRSRHRDALGGRDRRGARQPRHHADDHRHAAPRSRSSARCLAEDFEPVLALLGDIVMAPSLPEEEIATRKGEVITAIRQDEDNPAVRASEALMALLYPDGHPYGRRTKGSIDVVEQLTREQLLRLHAERFAPSELTAVVVGDVEPARRATRSTARVFGGWQHAGAAAAAACRRSSPPAERRRVVIPMMNKAQADIAYGFTTITRTRSGVLRVLADEQRVRPVRDRRPAWRQHPRAAGDGVLRVELARRERRAGAAGHPRRRQPGERRSRGRVDRRGDRRACVRDGLTPKELDESRRYLIGSMPRALETNAAIANFLQIGRVLRPRPRLRRRACPGLLRRGHAGRSECRRAPTRSIPERATVVIAGPYQ